MSFLFNDLTHLKALTEWLKMKTYLKSGKHYNMIGLMVGCLVMAIVFMIGVVISAIEGKVRVEIISAIFSCVVAFLPIHAVGNFIDDVHNSKTYSLKDKINRIWIYYQPEDYMFGDKYYIVAKLRGHRFLTQTIEDIDKTPSCQDNYEVFKDGKLIGHVGCTDYMHLSSRKYAHRFAWLLFTSIYIVLVALMIVAYVIMKLAVL